MSEAATDQPPAPAGRKKYEPRALSAWVRSMIRAYVTQKVKKRTGKASDYKSQDSREAVNRICMDAFYQIRSRKDHRDFVNYWTSTICSVPQFIHSEEFADVAGILLDEERWEDVQSLALLALSAESQQEPRAAAEQTKQP